MIEGFTADERADYADALVRRRLAWTKQPPPLRQHLPWKTLSGFADRYYFLAALSRSWPMFPPTGDVETILRILHWPMPIMLSPVISQAVPSDELSN